MKTLLHTLGLAATAASLILSQNASAGQPLPHITASKITIDGKINEPAWREAKKITLDYVTSPYDNAAPPVKTTAYIFEDGTTLYVAFDAEVDKKEEIRANLRNRDEIENDDNVNIKIDTFGDARKAFIFSANPFGVQKDVVDNEHNNTANLTWDAEWGSAGSVGDNAYYVEMAIPLNSLQYSSEDGKPLRWRFELYRYHRRDLTYRISHMPFDRNMACRLCQMDEVTLFEGRKVQKSISVIPEVTVGWQRNRPGEGFPWEHTQKQNYGITARWQMSPSSQIMGTVNPDFSQVEADASALNINEPFTLYFQERRLFFTEAAETFESHDELVYTRNIASPNWGIKTTNQFGDHNLSVLLAEDSQTSILIPNTLNSTVTTLSEKSIQGALRYRYAINEQASMGFTGTTRQADAYENNLISVDAKYRLTNNGTLYYQDSFSSTRYPYGIQEQYCYTTDCNNSEAYQARSDETITGRRTILEYEEEREHIYFWAAHIDTDIDYRADLGFQRDVGIKQNRLYTYYQWYNEDSWWNRIFLGMDIDYRDAHDGGFISQNNDVFIGFYGPWQSQVSISRVNSTRIGFRRDIGNRGIKNNANLFSNDGWDFSLSLSPTKWLNVYAYAMKSDAIDYNGDRQGKEDYYNLETTWRLSKNFELTLDMTHNPFSLPDTWLYDANIVDIRATYNPSNRHQLKVTAIHYRINQNPDAYQYSVSEKYRNWELQIIYTYEVNHLTRIHMGIASLDYKVGQMPNMAPSDQSAFMKMSYGFSI